MLDVSEVAVIIKDSYGGLIGTRSSDEDVRTA